jgi:Flp pilus assembly protein CpaB
MSATESVAAVAAVVSAVFGGLAVVAAFRSAASAQKAQASADDAERRAVLRQVVSTARDTELEAGRGIDAAALAARSRQDLAIFTGGLGGSRSRLSQETYAAKTKRAEEIASEAKLFSGEPIMLEKVPPSELDRVLTKLIALLSEARALREDLERERIDLEGQCATYRKAVLAKGWGSDA